MTKTKYFFTVGLLMTAISTTTFAEDLYWGNNSGSWWGKYNVNWMYADLSSSPRYPSATDNAIFDYNIMKYKSNASLSESMSCHDLVFQNSFEETDGVRTAKYYQMASTNSASPTLTITGNLIKYRGESFGDTTILSEKAANRLSINITGTDGEEESGNLIFGSSTDATTNISGNLGIGGSSFASALEKLRISFIHAKYHITHSSAYIGTAGIFWRA